MIGRKFFCLGVVVLLGHLNAHADTAVEWRVVDPFSLVDYQKLASASSVDYRIAPGQSAFGFVTERMSSGSRTMLPPLGAVKWDRSFSVNRRVPVDYIFPKTREIAVVLTGAPSGQCRWKYGVSTGESRCDQSFEVEANTQFGVGESMLTVDLPNGRTIEAEIIVRDRLVLGLGDSYASGEGNPDIPTLMDQEGLNRLAVTNNDRATTGRWMKKKSYWIADDAQWFDKQCHRSMFSQHMMAALRLASRNPHESVTVLPLACSGAEILDGVLNAQQKPPGGGKYVADSQVNIAIHHLCKDGRFASVKKTFYKGHSSKEHRHSESANLSRCEGLLRVPDAVLLSIGGNDVGFAPSIAWATLPDGWRNRFGALSVNLSHEVTSPVCPKETGAKVCKKNLPVGRDRVKYWLPGYYKYLAEELVESGLVSDPGSVFLTAYPEPVYLEDGATLCGKDRSSDMNEQARSRLLKVFVTPKWELGITESEMRAIRDGLVRPLMSQMRYSAGVHKWNFIDGYVGDVRPHGICAGYMRQDASVPIYPHVRAGEWYPENPGNLWAYDVGRQRWFRNTNDSVLFQTDDTKSGINGAFHPDFRVHALVADYLYEAIDQRWSSN